MGGIRLARWVPAITLPLLALIASLPAEPATVTAPPPTPLRLELDVDIDYPDPALAYYVPTWQLEQATCAKLLNQPDAPPPEGGRLVPEIAAAMPTVSADGTTYTFEIRPGFAFSPPASGEVTAQSMKYTFERTLSPIASSPARPFFDDIAGARKYVRGEAPSISGITASGSTLAFTLVRPATDFLARVALPFMCAVPTSLPPNPNGALPPIPSAGPYYIASWTPRQSLVALPNPNYTGTRLRRWSSIQYAIGAPLATIRQNIEAGTTDYGPVPAADHAELATLYGPDSPAAQGGNQQWFAHVAPTLRYIAMNTERSLFSTVNMRRAVNFAINRADLIAARGPHAGRPTDQYIPRNAPGFVDEDIYPLTAPNIDLARELADWQPGEPLRPGVLYTCTALTCQSGATIIRDNLLQIGIDLTIRSFPRATQFQLAGRRGEPFDMTYEGWHMDRADGIDTLALMDGTTIKPTNNVNFSYFNDEWFNARLAQVQSLPYGPARNQMLADLDADLARDAAPLAAYMNDNAREFFSRRIGCHAYHPLTEMNLLALCVRPELTIDDVTVAEPQSGTTEATFTLRLSSRQSNTVTVEYQTADETAEAGEDYVAETGTVTFAPNEREQTVSITVNADQVQDAGESFAVLLSNHSHGTIVDGHGRAVITEGPSLRTPMGPPPPPPPPPPPGPPPPPMPPPPLFEYTVSTQTNQTLVPGNADIGLHCDDCSRLIELPFPVNAYGTWHWRVEVSSNGNVQFSNRNFEYTNTCLPHTLMGRMLAPVWDDLRTDQGQDGVYTAVVGSAPNRTFVIEWRASFFSGAGGANFEVLFNEGSGTLRTIYGPVSGLGASATAGIQNFGSGPQTQYSCNSAVLTNGLGVNYVPTGQLPPQPPPPPPLPPPPPPGPPPPPPGPPPPPPVPPPPPPPPPPLPPPPPPPPGPPPPAPPMPPPPPPPPPAPPRCVVPRVVGQPLARARTRIRSARCRVGRVRYARSSRARGRVIGQTPRAGSRRAVGTRVHLVVSRGRR